MKQVGTNPPPPDPTKVGGVGARTTPETAVEPQAPLHGPDQSLLGRSASAPVPPTEPPTPAEAPAKGNAAAKKAKRGSTSSTANTPAPRIQAGDSQAPPNVLLEDQSRPLTLDELRDIEQTPGVTPIISEAPTRPPITGQARPTTVASFEPVAQAAAPEAPKSVLAAEALPPPEGEARRLKLPGIALKKVPLGQRIINHFKGMVGRSDPVLDRWEKLQIINALEPQVQAMSDDDLRGMTTSFKARLAKGETLDDILPEAFAVMRESMRRWSVPPRRPYNVQLIGAMILHEGGIAELATGEGKSSTVAPLAVYLNALEGKGVHVISVNEPLADRDGRNLATVCSKLGLSVGINLDKMSVADKRAAYNADITFMMNSTAGFDYLRDNMARDDSEVVNTREPNFAIIDEVDDILIDEARTPLIISEDREPAGLLYRTFARLVDLLEPGKDYEVDEKFRTVGPTEEGIQRLTNMVGQLIDEGKLDLDGFDPRKAEGGLYAENSPSLPMHIQRALEAKAFYHVDDDYRVEPGRLYLPDGSVAVLEDPERNPELAGKGVQPARFVLPNGKAPEFVNGQPIMLVRGSMAYLPAGTFIQHPDGTSSVLAEDQQMVLVGGGRLEPPSVDIVDEFTGRVLDGRRFSDGLHQALEAKEGVPLRPEQITKSSITFPQLFKRYKKLSGMSGTAKTEEAEFLSLYNLPVSVVPPNLPSVRRDDPDAVHLGQQVKYEALADEIAAVHKEGGPVVALTTTINNNLYLAQMLDKRNVPYQLLNAASVKDNTAGENAMIARAGRCLVVTLATNVAGRGVDIDADQVNFFKLGSHAQEDFLQGRRVAALLSTQAEAERARTWLDANFIPVGQVVRLSELAKQPLDFKPAEYVGDSQPIAAVNLLVEDRVGPSRGIRPPLEDTELLTPFGSNDTGAQASDGIDWFGMIMDARAHFNEGKKVAITVPSTAMAEQARRWLTQNGVPAMPGSTPLSEMQSGHQLSYTPPAAQDRIRPMFMVSDEARKQGLPRLDEQLAQPLYAPVFIVDDRPPEQRNDPLPDLGGEVTLLNTEDKPYQTGGLRLLSAEHNLARRIDRQGIGRTARQGHPGSSRTFVSVGHLVEVPPENGEKKARTVVVDQDELLAIYGDKLEGFMKQKRDGAEGEASFAKWIGPVVYKAQRTVEGMNFEVRKQTAQYDEVLNVQRECFFRDRREIRHGADLTEELPDWAEQGVDKVFEDNKEARAAYFDQKTARSLWQKMCNFYDLKELTEPACLQQPDVGNHELHKAMVTALNERIAERRKALGDDGWKSLLRTSMLDAMDEGWYGQLSAMEMLQKQVHWAPMVQQKPEDQYKILAYQSWCDMQAGVKRDVLGRLLTPAEPQAAEVEQPPVPVPATDNTVANPPQKVTSYQRTLQALTTDVAASLKPSLPPGAGEPVELITVSPSDRDLAVVRDAMLLQYESLLQDPDFPTPVRTVQTPEGPQQVRLMPLLFTGLAPSQIPGGPTMQSIVMLRPDGVTEEEYYKARNILFGATQQRLANWNEVPMLGVAAPAEARVNRPEPARTSGSFDDRSRQDFKVDMGIPDLQARDYISVPHNDFNFNRALDSLILSQGELMHDPTFPQTTGSQYTAEQGWDQEPISPVVMPPAVNAGDPKTGQLTNLIVLARHPNATEEQYVAARNRIIEATNQRLERWKEPTIEPFDRAAGAVASGGAAATTGVTAAGRPAAGEVLATVNQTGELAAGSVPAASPNNATITLGKSSPAPSIS